MVAAFCFAAFGFNSCLDYDVPTDDFRPNEESNDATDKDLHGNPDEIDFTREVTEEELATAIKNLEQYFAATMTGQKGMRGGKNGNYPGEHAYQRQYTLTDVYAEYATIPHYDFAYASYLNYSYSVSRDWNVGPNGQYGIVRTNIAPILNHPDIDLIPEMKAIYLLIYDYSSLEVADIYGPMPFKALKKNYDQPPFDFDALSDIYANIGENLDAILACLKHFDEQPAWYKDEVQKLMDKYLIITNDRRTKRKGMLTWIKFANSLKLRMAMHIVKVDPTLAKQWAEDAVAGGVITDIADEIGFFPTSYVGMHPLFVISETWSDERLNASFESLLKSLGHPYSGMLYMMNGGVIVNNKTKEIALAYDNAKVQADPNADGGTQVVGIRSGTRTGLGQSGSSNQYNNFSRLRKQMIQTAPLYIFKRAEIDFLRAEGALRGWNMGGTASFFYNRGIDNSSLLDPNTTTDWTKGYTTFMKTYKNSTAINPFVYKDPTGVTPDIESVTKICAKWNEGDDVETKLEKIITQKYIALFPNSFEAWVDMRRTGYPKTFPVLNPRQGDGTLNDGDLVRRMLFPYDDDASLEDIRRTAIPALLKDNPSSLGDKQATRLWWDRPTGNF